MYVGIDVGGTKTLLALLSAEGEIVKSDKFDTPDDYPDLLTSLQQHAVALGGGPYEMAAAGVPGVIERDTGAVTAYGNRPWQDTPVATDFGKVLGCPVLVENDGKAGGLAEANLLINEFNNVLYLAIGTGIGIANIINGVNNTKVSDGGGHVFQIEHNGKLQPWEDFASGSAIVKQFGQKASEITDPTTWQKIAYNLSVGMVDLIASLTPDVIVIGGGVGRHFDKFAGALEQELAKYQSDMLTIPPLRQAQHAEEAVIYGCYQLIKQHGQTA